MAEQKSMAIALILSFLIGGLGLIYAGDTKRGLIIFIAWLIFELIFYFVAIIAGIIVFIVWIYGMYATYTYVKEING